MALFKKVTDTLLHILLGILLVELSGLLSGGVDLGDGLNVGFILFFRELTQIQTRDYGSSFFKGWNFFRWNTWKNIETWIPVLAVIFYAVWRGNGVW